MTFQKKTRYTWPLAMQARDVIGVAATGSGKTLAFLQLGIVMKTTCQRDSGRGLDSRQGTPAWRIIPLSK